MKCVLILTVALIAFVAGNGAWERNKEYTYRLLGRTLKPSPESNNNLIGVVSQAYLSIRPQSDDLLIGRITRAEYGKVNGTLSEEWTSKLNSRNLDSSLLNKPFKIHLQNGVIRSLSVDNSLTNHEVNQLKVIVSQFQLDTNAQNQIQFNENQLPETHDNAAFYKTMEPLVTGNCETVYEMSTIPDYLIRANSEWIPLPELKGEGQFIQIVKSRSYKNCHETSDYLLDMAGRKDSNLNRMRQNRIFFSDDTNLLLTEDRRIVISGSLKGYTIQSSVTVNKVNNRHDDRLELYDLVNVTLESVVERTDRIENPTDLRNTGNLVYTFETTTPMRSYSHPRLSTGLSNGDNNQDIWTNCWTAFPSAGTICKSDFSPEYMSVGTHSCGFLGLGKQALCRLNFPGCVATACYSIFVHHEELCGLSFGEEYPVTKGGFDDCAPGFYRSRCCSK